MDNKRIEYFKDRLLEEREKVIKSIESIQKRENETKEQLSSELSSYNNHPADTGTEIYMMKQDKGFKRQSEDILEAIDQSLLDMEKEKYGYCDNCNKKIDEKRLDLIPYAKTCLGCSNEEDIYEGQLEYETKGDERLGYIRDTSSELGYDREDVYKDVMQDNIVPNDPSFSTGDNIGLIDEDNDDF